MRLSTLRSGLLAAAIVCAAAISPYPSTAGASGKSSFEPVFIAGGFLATCNPNSGIALAVTDTLRNPSPAWDVPHPVDPADVSVWGVTGAFNERYLMCSDLSVPYLAQNFERALRTFRNHEMALYNIDPAAPPVVDKIDVLGMSLGTIVSRYCIKFDPLPATLPGEKSCADMIDDWVGLVPPSHGSSNFTNGNCAYTAMYEKICRALIPGSLVQYQLRSGDDETPFGDSDPGGHIEYSTIWSNDDGTIEPATSAKLSGAVNHQVINGFMNTAPAGQAPHEVPTVIKHGDIVNRTKCPGGDFVGPATGEWAAYEMLDVQPHLDPAATAPTLADSTNIDCLTGP